MFARLFVILKNQQRKGKEGDCDKHQLLHQVCHGTGLGAVSVTVNPYGDIAITVVAIVIRKSTPAMIATATTNFSTKTNFAI